MKAKIEALRRWFKVSCAKRDAKRLYLQYLALLDKIDAMSCGNHVADQLYGYRRDWIATKFNQRLDTLAALGEPVPPMRLTCSNHFTNHKETQDEKQAV